MHSGIIGRYQAAAVAAVLGLLLAACGGAAAAPASPSGKQILVEGSISLTGGFAEAGKVYEKTYRHYIDELNKNGGLLGRPLKLALTDDESDSQKAVALYDKFVNSDKADLLLAPYGTPIMGEVIPAVESAKMVFVQAGTAASSLLQGHGNQYTFTALTFLDRDYARPWIDWINTLPADQRPTTLAIFTINSPVTIGMQKSLLEYAKQAGLNVAVDEFYDPSSSDFTSLVQKAKDANVGALALLSGYPDSVQIAKTMADQKFKPKTWFNAASSTLPGWTNELKDAGDYTVSPVQAWPTQKTNGIGQLLAWSKAELKVDYITFQAGAAQTAAEVLTAGVKGCGKIDQDCIADWLHKNPVDSVSGQLKFNGDGIPDYSAILVQVQKGKDIAVFPAELADGKVIYPAP